MFADGIDHVAGGEISRGNLVGVEPDAHGIVAGTEDLHVARARDARQDVFDLKRCIVAQINLVVAARGGEQMHDHGQIGRLFGCRHTQLSDLLGQFGKHLGDAVLHLDLGFVHVGAEPEGHRQRHDPVGRRLREHVKRVLHAIDGLLQGRGDGFGDGLGVGSGINRADHDRGGNHLGVFADGQAKHGDQPDKEDHRREHAGENRAADEEVGEVHKVNPWD